MKSGEKDNYKKWEVGDKVELIHKLVEKDVADFASLTGDKNPLHVDRDYASQTNFGQRVVHGMLSASFISTMIGMRLPGAGALWMSQTLNFQSPARIGDIITVKATVVSKSDSQRILGLEIEVSNQNKQVLIDGTSRVKVIEAQEREDKEKKERKQGGAIVTGASRGIGAAVAKSLAKKGIPVVINYRESEKEALLVLKDIEKKGGQAIICKADVSKREEVRSLVDYAKESFGEIDILVNNASGSIVNKRFENLDWEDINKHLNIQVKGAFNFCQEILPLMKKNGYGKVINISSIYTDGVPPVQTYDYIIAKSALTSLTKSLAAEYGVNGICINNVSPGMTETTLIGDIPEKTKLLTKMQTPLRRLAKVEDIANVVSMLVSEAGDYITGETVRVCGGQRMI